MSLEKEVNKTSCNPFMILGHPRSGTNFLATILKSHPKISLLREPFSMHNGYIRANFFRYWSGDSYDSTIHHDEMPEYPASIDFFTDFRAWLIAEGGEARGFKETTFLMKLEWLQQYLPGINVIYLERDPRGIVSSFKKGNLFERWNYQEIFYGLINDATQMPRLQQYKEIIEDTNESNWIDVLTTMYIISTSEAKRNLPQFRHTQVKYEVIAANLDSSFAEILAFLGLQMDERVKKEIQERCSETRGGTFSTYRNSRETAQQYKYFLTPNEMMLINTKMQRRGL